MDCQLQLINSAVLMTSGSRAGQYTAFPVDTEPIQKP